VLGFAGELIRHLLHLQNVAAAGIRHALNDDFKVFLDWVLDGAERLHHCLALCLLPHKQQPQTHSKELSPNTI